MSLPYSQQKNSPCPVAKSARLRNPARAISNRYPRRLELTLCFFSLNKTSPSNRHIAAFLIEPEQCIRRPLFSLPLIPFASPCRTSLYQSPFTFNPFPDSFHHLSSQFQSQQGWIEFLRKLLKTKGRFRNQSQQNSTVLAIAKDRNALEEKQTRVGGDERQIENLGSGGEESVGGITMREANFGNG